MPHETHHQRLPRQLRTLQGAATILAVLILTLVIPKALPRAEPARAPAAAADAATSTVWTVSKVVDGDTLDADGPGGTVRVRLIGINTPETVDPRKKVECFGHEASDFAKQLLTDTEVRLEADSSQDDQDKYGRVLRYVFLADGTLVNEKLIAEGYAYEYTYDRPYRYRDRFKDAERVARLAGKGLWSPTTCNGLKTPVQ